VSFCKRRGFIFTGSELYGGIGTGYDYGPLGAALKRNLVDAWWRDFITRRPDCVGLETALLMNPRVWEASGHVQQFVDPLTECATCRKRVRADKLVKAALEERQPHTEGAAAGGTVAAAGTARSANKQGRAAAAASAAPLPDWLPADPSAAAALTLVQLGEAIHALRCACPGCGAVGDKGLGTPRTFNLLFSTHVGPVLPSDVAAAASAAAPATDPLARGTVAAAGAAAAAAGAGSHAYLRPETAQGVYVHFLNVLNTTRKRLPFGVGQAGKSFRNEIAVSNFVFRTREFDQMELQYFCHPDDSARIYDEWVTFCHDWLTRRAGLLPDAVRRRSYEKRELAHYALATTDLEFRFPFGWDELWGVANRGSFDLQAHSAGAGVQLAYTEPGTNKVCDGRS
jgi:glycyl-tRNA synthetase